MAAGTSPRDTRTKLLDAADSVVARDGPAALTLERAAAEAGVAKGTLLYHFATKHDLVAAMVTRLLDGFDGQVEKRCAHDAAPPGRYARAYAHTSFDPRLDAKTSSAGLVAALSVDPSLLDEAGRRHAGYQRRLEQDGVSPALATLVRLAADGLYFARALDLAPPSRTRTGDVLELLLALLDAESEAP